MQHTFSRGFRCAIVCAALMAMRFAPLAKADIEYNVVDLGTLGGNYSQAYAINNSGQVVGVATLAGGQEHAFLYQNGSMVDLGTLGGSYSQATAINNSGVIVGTTADSTGQPLGFIYKNGAMTALPALPNTTIIHVNGINDFGQVVGNFKSSDAADYPHAANSQPFIYSGGVVTPIPTVSFSGNGYAINNSGVVVGFLFSGNPVSGGSPFRYENGQFSPVPSNILSGAASAINGAGQIAGNIGYAETASRAFIWQGDSATLWDDGFPLGINSTGEIVGTTQVGLAFVYKNGTFSYLQFLVDPSSNLRLTSADGINDLGQIVGYGKTPDGSEHAFLLNPTPEPTTIAIVGVAASFLLVRRRPHGAHPH